MTVFTASMQLRPSGLANSQTGKVVTVCADKTAVLYCSRLIWMSAKLSSVWPQLLLLVKRLLASGVGQVNECARVIGRF